MLLAARSPADHTSTESFQSLWDQSATGESNLMVLLFDLDGTLTDPKVGILGCTRYALSALGKPCPPDEVLTSFIGPPLRQMFSVLLNTSDRTVIEEAVSVYRRQYRDHGIYDTHLYEGVPAMLRRARDYVSRMLVATSKPTVFADLILRHFDLAPHFDRAYGADLDGRFDNKTDLLSAILGAEAIRPEEALMVGDRAADVIAAKANALASVGVLWGYGSEQELRQAGADHLCSSPANLDACLACE